MQIPSTPGTLTWFSLQPPPFEKSRVPLLPPPEEFFPEGLPDEPWRATNRSSVVAYREPSSVDTLLTWKSHRRVVGRPWRTVTPLARHPAPRCATSNLRASHW
jgi:hypothetical protein